MSNNSDQTPFDDDSTKQLNDYLKAIESLRGSIIGLNTPIVGVSKNIKDLNADLNKLSGSVNQMAKDSQAADGANNKLSDGLEKLTKIYDVLTKAIEIVKGAFTSLEATLTLGLTLIIAYGPEILNIVSSWIKGKETISQATLSINSLNKALGSNECATAAKQFNELKINIGLAKEGTLSKKEVLKQYNETLGKTMGQAKNLNDAERKLITDGPAYIQMTLNKAAAQIALQDAAKKSFEAQQIRQQSDDETLSFWDKAKSYVVAAASPVGFATAQADMLVTAAVKRAKNAKDAEAEKDKLLKIAEDFQKKAALIAKNNNLFFEPKENNYGVRPKAPKPDTTRLPQLLPAKSISFVDQITQDKKQYDLELALLQGNLDKKLITQEEFKKRSWQLQDQYHQGIGGKVQEFAETQMAEMQKHLQEVADADKQAAKISEDEKNIKKAILPADKLAAEKQFITDKFSYEIQLAQGNKEKITELEVQKQQALTALTQQYEQQRRDFALNTAQQVADKAFGIIGNNIKASSDAKIKGLEKDKVGELSNKNLTATQRKAIEEKYKKKEAEEKVKAFKAEQKASVVQAVVNGALAITKATSQTGVFAAFVIPGIIASTALQVATIIAQKPPAFAKGGRFVSDGRGALLPGYSRTDNTNAYLRSGEAVVVSEAMRNPWARNLVSAINVAHGGRDFSMPNTGRGYAIGGIFTDGGNANRYYNQPINDIKDMANTLAYQMINNFPPIYVDVKDVNNQQNILAQTVNRVNL
jgi:hypothetical protein